MGSTTAAFGYLFNYDAHKLLNTRESCPDTCTLVSMPDGKAWVPIGAAANAATKSALGDPQTPTKENLAKALGVTAAASGTIAIAVPATTVGAVATVVAGGTGALGFVINPTPESFIDYALGASGKAFSLLSRSVGETIDRINNIRDWYNTSNSNSDKNN